MIILHGDSLKISVTASKSFPNGFEITTFADEGAGAESVCPLDIGAAAYVAVYVPSDSAAATNMRVLSHRDDDITFNVTFKSGVRLELKNGFINGSSQMPGGDMEFFFTFRDKSAAEKSVARKAKGKIKTAKEAFTPAGVTLH
jgi:hypothetical protein